MICELCKDTGEDLLWHDTEYRVVMVDDPDYPGFCRVIWNDHIREMTDLANDERSRLMDAVFLVEEAIRNTLSPDKINLASLGNMTPHIHWHVIPRFLNDSHFPKPIWTEPVRPGTVKMTPGWKARLKAAVQAAFCRDR